MRHLFPTLVTPPSPDALFMVANSLIQQFLPIITFVGSPLYPRSCGSPPIDANGEIFVPSPISAYSMLAFAPIFTPDAMVTLSPIKTFGPISTSGAIFALSDIIAVL